MIELPPDKGIIVWIRVSRNEGSTPIDLNSENSNLLIVTAEFKVKGTYVHANSF